MSGAFYCFKPKALRFHYHLSSDSAKAIEQLERVRFMLEYYSMDEKLLHTAREQAQLSRLRYYMPGGMDKEDERAVAIALSGTKGSIITARIQQLRNMDQLLRSAQPLEDVPSGARTLSFRTLREDHRSLYQDMPQSALGGALRSSINDLFSNTPELARYPAQPIEWQPPIEALIQDTATHPLIRAWLIYFLLVNLRPFERESEEIARIFLYRFLNATGFGFGGLLVTEQYVFAQKRMQAFLQSLGENTPFIQRVETDISTYLNICLEGMARNADDVQDTAVSLIQLAMQYDIMGPRTRNHFKFWMEQGFERHWQKLALLEDAQFDALEDILRLGEQTLSALQQKLGLERRSLQRSMAGLVELGILEPRGAGAELRYLFNFETHPPHPAIRHTIRL